MKQVSLGVSAIVDLKFNGASETKTERYTVDHNRHDHTGPHALVLSRHCVREDDRGSRQRRIHCKGGDDGGEKEVGPVYRMDGSQGHEKGRDEVAQHCKQHDRRGWNLGDDFANDQCCSYAGDEDRRKPRSHLNGSLATDIETDSDDVEKLDTLLV